MIKRLESHCVVLRRRVCEALGYDRFSRPARDDLDEKLQAYLPRTGFFVEAGAHDGFLDSNTYYLEKMRGWRGVLVEPIPGNYRSCMVHRKRSHVFNCALVAQCEPGQTVPMMFGDRMSFVEGAYDAQTREQRLRSVRKFLEPQRIEVPARTLTSILEEVGVAHVDFFSLDVEGFEMQVLQGLDFERFAPNFLLVECQTEAAYAEVAAFLQPRYTLENKLSHHDHLFVCASLSS